MYSAGGTAASSLGQQTRAEPTTELEGSIAEIRSRLDSALSSVRQIASRVLPPTPEKAGGPNVSPIAVTYHQKLAELAGIADNIQCLVGELNGRI